MLSNFLVVTEFLKSVKISQSFHQSSAANFTVQFSVAAGY